MLLRKGTGWSRDEPDKPDEPVSSKVAGPWPAAAGPRWLARHQRFLGCRHSPARSEPIYRAPRSACVRLRTSSDGSSDSSGPGLDEPRTADPPGHDRADPRVRASARPSPCTMVLNTRPSPSRRTTPARQRAAAGGTASQLAVGCRGWKSLNPGSPNEGHVVSFDPRCAGRLSGAPAASADATTPGFPPRRADRRR